MVHRISTLCFLLLFSALVYAQSWDSIKRDPSYLCGEGYGSTIAEADRNALSDLTSKITTHVSNTFDIIEEESSNGQSVDSKTYVSNRVRTYSQATLNNTERLIIQNEPNAHVGRWIKRSEIAKLFESRKIKAKDMIEAALRAESMGKVDDALRNYYWAFALIRSLQHPNEVTYTTEDGVSHVLMNWIKERMDAIFDDVKIMATSRENDDVNLSITYQGKAVTSIDYTFFDGRDWSNLYSAKDGCGVLELAKGNDSDSYQIKIEFEYLGESLIDKEVESVLSVISSTPMRKSYKTVTALHENQKRLQAQGTIEDFSTISETLIAKPTVVQNTSSYSRTLNSVLASITTKKYDANGTLFTASGMETYTKLLKYGTAKLIGDPSTVYYESTNGVVARGIKMSFSFKTGIRKSFVEDVVFYFDTEGKICNITFGLGDAAEKDILYKGVWSESARKSIMEFMENYKTAYALKRLDYIETIFDDDAVIIVGNVASRMKNSKEFDNVSSNNQIIRHNRYTKNQYLKQLKRCFSSNEFINIRFANNDVIKLGKGGETYAIQISQDYYSSTYGDKGYLFLIVDINDPTHPLIRVRTWQPEKDPKFGLYGPGDFK